MTLTCQQILWMQVCVAAQYTHGRRLHYVLDVYSMILYCRPSVHVQNCSSYGVMVGLLHSNRKSHLLLLLLLLF